MCKPVNSTAQKWDLKVDDYPRFENEQNSFEVQVLNLLNSWGVEFKDQRVLDIGCGTGVYTLHIAKEAKQTIGVDFSKNMLDVLEKDAKYHNIKNLETYCCDFKKFDENLEKYDWVFSSMSPALNTAYARQKATDLASCGVAYLGWGGKRDSLIMKEVFKAHGEKMDDPASANELKKWLEKEKISYKSKYLETTWTKTLSLEDMISSEAWHLDMHGITPNVKILKDVLLQFCDENNQIIHKTDVGLELISWEK